jgi:hypothetical protein
MGIFNNLFGAVPNTNPAAVANQQTPGNIPAQAQQTMQGQQNLSTAPNGVVPAMDDKQLQKTGEVKQEAPLAEFKDLWKNEPKLDAAGKPIVENNSIFGQVDSAALLKAAQQIDFTKDIVTPEVLQAIQAGGEQGTAAFLSVLNKSNQLVYAKSAEVTTALIEKGLREAEGRFVDKLPQHVRAANVSDLVSQNPMFNDPAARPIIDMVVKQLQANNPNATPRELDEMAGKYFTQFGSTLNTATRNGTADNTRSGNPLRHSEQDFSFMLDEQSNPFGSQ